MKIRKSSKLLLIIAAVLMFIFSITSYYSNITLTSDINIMILIYIIRPMCVFLSVIFVIIAVFRIFLDFIKTSELFQKEKRVENNGLEDLRNQLIENSTHRDIIELMLANMGEIRQYYAISKSHARLAFVLATAFSALGFLLFFITIFYFKDDSLQLLSSGVISGMICELFAGTALLVYRDSLRQLNQYYKSLHENEKFLSVVNLAGRLPEEQQNQIIEKIIDSSLEDIANMVQVNNRENENSKKGKCKEYKEEI